MTSSKGIQLAVIGALAVLFFVMARFADRGISPVVLGGACVAALILIFVIVRFGRPVSPAASAPAAGAPSAGKRAKSYPRTLAVLAAVAFFEIAQYSTAGTAVKIAAGVAAAALLVWAVIYTRRSRGGS